MRRSGGIRYDFPNGCQVTLSRHAEVPSRARSLATLESQHDWLEVRPLLRSRLSSPKCEVPTLPTVEVDGAAMTLGYALWAEMRPRASAITAVEALLPSSRASEVPGTGERLKVSLFVQPILQLQVIRVHRPIQVSDGIEVSRLHESSDTESHQSPTVRPALRSSIDERDVPTISDY